MDSFSWSDSIRATLGSCLPCLKADADSDDEGHGQGQRRINGTSLRNNAANAREELERLLDEPITDPEDAETMSLHSNVGQRKKKRRKTQKGKTTTKSVRILGVDLFGRRPIRSPEAVEDEDEEDLAVGSDNRRRIRTISTSTLDSDAAPLADEAIVDFTVRARDRWAPSKTDEELANEERLERERIEKEQRKELRRERKEIKRLAELGAFASTTGGDEFEGFPGSGQMSHPDILVSPAPKDEEFGPFVAGSHNRPAQQEDKEPDEEADFDAAAYTKKSRVSDGEGSRSGSGSHTRSRSRTSASLSADGSPAPRESRRSGKAPSSTRSPLSEQARSSSPSAKKTSKGSKQRDHKKSKASRSSLASSSATPSLPSPASTPSPEVNIHTQEFDGVPGGLASARDHFKAFTQPANISSPPPSSAGFPSTGFTSFKRTTSSGLSSGAGVALARRGND